MTDRPPFLLTPGPLTTSKTVRQAMTRDWGSWDSEFKAITARVRRGILDIAGAGDTHVCVPIQGSGTFVVEAMLGTMIPRDGRVLIVTNGAYGQRIAQTCRVIGRDYDVLEAAEDQVPDPAKVAARLEADPGITHVAIVHCETTSGILNPVEAVAEVAARHGRSLLIDAMSTFAAMPLEAGQIHYDALVASANKCLEAAPGAGFMVARKDALENCAGNAHSLSLDLHDQWVHMEKTGQWRYTPPTHIIAALDQAITEHRQAGGVPARGARYAENRRVLLAGARALGLETLVEDALQSPIIVTLHCPDDPAFDFSTFYELIKARGFIIYPGKITEAETFRVGCIGQVYPDTMAEAVAAIGAALEEMGVTNRGSVAHRLSA
jgi:2-aminoethylphosphonate-pyruvate transaminase